MCPFYGAYCFFSVALLFMLYFKDVNRLWIFAFSFLLIRI
jgi:hypothetical protein